MKRPVTFLCLADLHYRDGNIPQIDKLGEDLCFFINGSCDEETTNERKKWDPDYLLIAGDIIDWTDSSKKIDNYVKYDNARAGIDRLIRRLGISKDHVIIIPGNHDNAIPDDVSTDTLKDNLNVFEDFCDKEKVDASALAEAFGRYFEDYIDFVKTYNQKTYSEYNKGSKQSFKVNIEFDSVALEKKESVTKILHYYAGNDSSDKPEYTDDFKKTKLKGGGDLEYISGVKVFPEDHLCFVLVNTEWLYTSDGPFSKYMRGGHYSDVKKYLKLYERCRLCPPFVRDAFDLIKQKYKDYTVVTLMHRGFEDLREARDKYVTDRAEIDAIDLIKNNSHLILTGHDHIPHMESPSLINNKVQNYKLGSVGRKDPTTGYHTHTATLIRIDRSLNLTEMLQTRYDKVSNSWILRSKDIEAFTLDSNCKRLFETEKNFDTIKIVAKSNSNTDIEKAICNFFGYEEKKHYIELRMVKDTEIGTCEINSNENTEKKTEQKTLLIVVWHDCDVCRVSLKESELRNESEMFKTTTNDIEKFKNDHKLAILKNEISIEEVYIDYPRYFKCSQCDSL